MIALEPYRSLTSNFQKSWLLGTAGILLGFYHTTAVAAFDFTQVADRARQLANSAYKPPDTSMPAELKALDFDHYQQISYKPDHILWRNTKSAFDLDFFPQAWQFNQPVKINEVTAQGVHEIRYNPNDFNWGRNKINPDNLRNQKFAGFRLHYPINAPNRQDEIVSFLGASYFRALGKNQRYGLSARGLAIDTALANGEEFPRFVEFWMVRPLPGAKQVVIYGLLDSPRATGAYRFILKPGVSTVMDVTARLYLRDKVGKLGLAPLSSMFFFSPGQRDNDDDYRPAVHDSSGLSIHMGNDEWIWRPLTNPKHLLVTSFTTSNPVGFGLMQRQRSFSDFEVPYLRYELRPSVWIEPIGKWGAGRVELVQIPTPDETNDNIVTYWVPDKQPAPKVAYDFAYRLWWQMEKETRPPELSVTQTLQGRGYTHTPDASISMAVDFAGTHTNNDAALFNPTPMVSVDGNAKLLEQKLIYNEATNGWRLSLRIQRLDATKPVEMRASLQNGNKAVSETWSYILPPD